MTTLRRSYHQMLLFAVVLLCPLLRALFSWGQIRLEEPCAKSGWKTCSTNGIFYLHVL